MHECWTTIPVKSHEWNGKDLTLDIQHTSWGSVFEPPKNHTYDTFSTWMSRFMNFQSFVTKSQFGDPGFRPNTMTFRFHKASTIPVTFGKYTVLLPRFFQLKFMAKEPYKMGRRVDLWVGTWCLVPRRRQPEFATSSLSRELNLEQRTESSHEQVWPVKKIWTTQLATWFPYPDSQCLIYLPTFG